MKTLYIITVFLFIISCTGSTKQELSDTEKAKSNTIVSEIYYNDTLNISFIKLQNWNIMENFHDVPVFCLSPRKNDQDFYQENITLVSENINNYNINEYYNSNIKGLQSFLNDFKIIHKGDWNNENGAHFKKLIYTTNSQGYTFKVLVFFTILKDKGYVVNCTALLNTFDEYEDDFNIFIESFKFE